MILMDDSWHVVLPKCHVVNVTPNGPRPLRDKLGLSQELIISISFPAANIMLQIRQHTRHHRLPSSQILYEHLVGRAPNQAEHEVHILGFRWRARECEEVPADGFGEAGRDMET